MKTKQLNNEQARRLAILRRVLKYIVCILLAVVMLFPMYWMITTSFKTPMNVAKFPPQWWPDPWTLANYVEIFTQRPFLRYLWNSLYTTVLTTAGVVLFSTLAGYAFAKIKFKGSNIL